MQMGYHTPMIRQIRGTVLETGLASVIIDVHGFGIEAKVANPSTFTVGAPVTLSTYLAVKQDGLELYGFETTEDLHFFELVISVSGIGPKTALSVLRRAPRAAVENAIGSRDLPYLTKVVGLGKKSAEKMIVELVEKVGPSTHTGDDGEVFDTLIALGYTEREARKAVQNIPASILGKEARLKAALAAH